MSQPQRIQRKRTAGWRMPEGAVYVGRPSRWGNPFRLGMECVRDQAHAVALHRSLLDQSPHLRRQIRAELAGRDLACWCPLNVACHADELIRIANSPATTTPDGDHP